MMKQLHKVPVLIYWDAVMSSRPTLGKAGRVDISRYQFLLELPGGTLSQSSHGSRPNSALKREEHL